MWILWYFNPYPAETESDLIFATSIESGQPAHHYSLTRHYTVGWPTASYCHDILKIDNGQFQKWKDRTGLFKKFSRLGLKPILINLLIQQSNKVFNNSLLKKGGKMEGNKWKKKKTKKKNIWWRENKIL